jgi:hypothetical protein
MKKYFLILFTFLFIKTNGQNSFSLEKILVGKWKDEVSTFTLSENGNYVISYKSGLEQKGKWSVKQNLLVFKSASSLMQYEIIDYSTGDFGYMIIKKGRRSTKSYHAVKLNE